MREYRILTQPRDELPEVNQGVSILIQELEQAGGQHLGVSATRPGKEQHEHALELLKVDAVLLQVRQAGVVPVQGIAAPAPVAAGQMLSLKNVAKWLLSLIRLQITVVTVGAASSPQVWGFLLYTGAPSL